MIRFLDWRNKLHLASLLRSNYRSKAKRARGRKVGAALRIEQFEDRRLLVISAIGVDSAYVEGVDPGNQTVATFSDPDGNPDPSLYDTQINWGDGTTTSGTVDYVGGTFFIVRGDHTYADEGSQIVSVDITDSADADTANNVTSTATVAENDTLLAGSATVAATEGTTFTGPVATFSDSTYPGNLASDLTATVDWGDGTTDAGTVSGGSGTFTVSGSHLYADEGSNPLSVTLTDDAPGTASATSTGTATVAEGDTLVAGTATVSATEGTTFTGTVATFSDTTFAGNLPSDFVASIDWGDGTTDAGTVSGGSGTFTVSGSHLYLDEGSNTLTVTLTDDSPGTASATATGTADVTDSDTLVAGTATVSATEGTTFTGTVATFSDTTFAGNLPSDFVASIDWGDGTTDAGTVSGGSGTFTVSGSHLYADEGSNTLTVTLTDDSPGTASATATGTADVTDSDTLVAGTATVSATEGTTFTGTVATFSDTTFAGNLPSDFVASIDWGDGTTDAGTVSGGSGTFTVSGSHLYADEASNTLTVTLTDDSPGTASATATGTADVTDSDTLVAGTATVSATEGTTFTGTVATFSDTTFAGNLPSDFVASIDWGDGTTDAGTVSSGSGTFTVSGSHLYADEGSNTLTVTLTDDSPGTASATATGTADVTDSDTLVAGTATVSATEGTTFTGTVATFSDTTFAGNLPSDFVASIDWGDGTTDAGTVSGGSGTFTVSGSHLYADEGSNPLTVTLTDDAPGTASATATGTADVTDSDTLVAGTATVSATEGTTFTGTVATFSDTTFAGNLPSDFVASIDWGDGTTDAGTVSGGSGSFTVSGSHLYADEGSNPLTVTLTDDAPGTASATATGTADVTDSDTLVAGTATVSATEGTTFTGTVATFSDTTFAGNLPSDFVASIDWGDGTTDAGTVSGGSGTFTVSGSHLYLDEGSNTLTVTLTDDSPGTASATATGTADVTDSDTLVAGTATVSATEGTTFTGTVATFSDTTFAGNLPSDFVASIDWGDGTTDAGTVSGGSGTFTVSGSHLYLDEGSNTLTVTLTDDSPGTASATATGTADVTDSDTLVAGTATVSATEGTTFTGTVATFSDTTFAGNLPSDFVASIDWGDGTTDAGTVSGGSGSFTVSGSHLYLDEGSNPLTVTLTDDAPGTASATATGTADVTDSDTLVAGTATVSATEGTTFTGTVATFSDTTFAGNLPSDFVASIDWGDGTTDAGTVSGGSGTFTVSGSHLYLDEGSNTLTVTLTDDSPGTASATATGTADVTDSDTLVAGTATVSATEGTTFTGTVATFSDSTFAGNLPSDFVASIDWGDGTTDAGTVSGGSGTFTVSGSHLYLDEGSNTLTVTLTDDSPGTASATATGTADVTDSDTLVAGTATVSATEGTTFTGTVATFSDSTFAGNLPSDFVASIDWGDGTTDAGTVSGGSGSFTVSGSHLYLDEGSNTLTVTLTDDAPGTASATATGTADVTDSDTLVAGTATVSATEGTTFTGTVATFSDTTFAGNLPSDFVASIDWGDGTTDAGTVSGGSGTFTVSGSHLYADEGSNTLTVTLTDDSPGTASATATGTATVTDNDTLVAGTSVTAASTEGATFSGTVATFADTTYAGNLPGDFSASIDWGDGTVSPGTVTGSAGSFTVGGSHVYSDEGTKTVTVVLSDDTPGTATGTATATIDVATVPIVSTAAAVSGFEFTPLSNVAVATFTHANGLEPASGFTATIDWGDGTSSPGTVTLSGTNYTVSGSHTYTDEKSYAVLVGVVDGAVSATVTSNASILEELLPGGTRGTADQRFISEVYRDLLNRAVDSSGLVFWTGVLAQGTNRNDMVNELEATPEFKNAEVNTLYEQYLHRAVDASGLQFWAPMLAAGKTVEQVAAMIAGSQEYFDARGQGTNDGFLDAIYEDALGRAPDSDGKTFFGLELAAGASRDTVASQIFGGIEYKRSVVANVFDNLLDRPAEEAALAGDALLLQQGMTDEQLIAAIASSPEYYNKTVN